MPWGSRSIPKCSSGLAITLFIAFALLGVFSEWSIALTFDPIQNLSTSSLGSVTPQIAVSGSNIFVVWEDGARNGPFQGCQSI
jgi:hypothetical protein